jgi:hypothetical protein
MRYVALFAILLALALAWRARTQPDAVPYAIELIRGTDTDKQPEPGDREVGPELAATFRSVFKWKDYWQVTSCRATAVRGKVTRLRLNHERAVEIDLTCPGKRRIAALWKGAVVGRAICPVGEGLTLIGGDRDQNSAWFIVVRREDTARSGSFEIRPAVLKAGL